MTRNDFTDRLMKNPRYARQVLALTSRPPAAALTPPQVKTASPTPAAARMNELESRIYEYLSSTEHDGRIIDLLYEAHEIALAFECTYTPDFSFTWNNIDCHVEVKGRQCWEDSRIKFKWATTVRPERIFVWAKLTKKKLIFEFWQAGAPIMRPDGFPI